MKALIVVLSLITIALLAIVILMLNRPTLAPVLPTVASMPITDNVDTWPVITMPPKPTLERTLHPQPAPNQDSEDNINPEDFTNNPGGN